MTGRDRKVLIGLIVLVVVAAGWMLVVSPERKKAESLNSKVSTAESTLSTAQTQLAAAQAAKAQYPKAYASVVTLGKAVPAEEEVPSLIVELEQASNTHAVEFNSITAGGGKGSSSSSGSTATVAASSGGFTQMPFTFQFSGGFFSLEKLFHQLTKFTTRTSAGLTVSGRLLTIQSVSLAPEASGSPSAHGAGQTLQGTITATAYVLPPGEALTAGAGAAAPAATGTTSSPTSAAAPPAIAKVTP